ncbi:MAG TPA: 2-hydroxyacid dehydrogenase [Devosia sp.]|nr:2-hydroxyacid dehydrogenase [Devosia sp.]
MKHVLVTSEMVRPCEPELEKLFHVHRLYDQPDVTTFLERHAQDIVAIAGAGVSADLIGRLPNLQIIAGFGVGYDSIDIAAARARAIPVTNTPDVLNDAVAELTLGLMLSLSRGIVRMDAHVRSGRWPGTIPPFFSELNGRTVGIAGLGRIGREIARRCQAMNMRVVYYGRNRQPAQPFVYYDDLEEMARDVDWLVAMTPGGAATDGLFSRSVLQALGPDGYFVNMARGSVVDQDALIDLLHNGELAGAALDVFADEPNVPDALKNMDNVVLSPHQGSATEQTRNAMGAMVVANLKAHFAGEPLLSRVV